MNAFVLEAAHDTERWNRFLTQLPWGDDSYFRAEYVHLQASPQRRAMLFCFSDPEHKFFYAHPFLLQKIPESLHAGPALYDIETAYGYGGPLASAPLQHLCQRADDAFCEWAQTQGVIAEFIRYHPLAGNHEIASTSVTVLEDRPTCSVELSVADLLTSFHGKARNMVRRALRECKAELLSCREFGDEFRTLYEADMRRLGAGDDYFFGNNYFARLNDLVDSQGFFIGVRDQGKISAAAMFLTGDCCAHYHLSATRSGSTTPGLVNLIIWAAAEEAARRGLGSLHLGGGRTAHPEDSLLKFKRRMGSKASMFHIGKRVHNHEVYEQLRGDWARRNPDIAKRLGERALYYRFGAR